MNISFRNNLAGWLVVAAWLLAATGVTWAGIASSQNFTLQRNSFSSGNPNAAAVPFSENFRLEAASLGEVSGAAMASGQYEQHPGYLKPWWSVFLRPDLIGIAIREGRLWLEWASVAGAASYTVERSLNARDFTVAEEGLDVPRWDTPVPVATSQFYRIRLWR